MTETIAWLLAMAMTETIAWLLAMAMTETIAWLLAMAIVLVGLAVRIWLLTP